MSLGPRHWFSCHPVLLTVRHPVIFVGVWQVGIINVVHVSWVNNPKKNQNPSCVLGRAWDWGLVPRGLDGKNQSINQFYLPQSRPPWGQTHHPGLFTGVQKLYFLMWFTWMHHWSGCFPPLFWVQWTTRRFWGDGLTNICIGVQKTKGPYTPGARSISQLFTEK